MHDASVDVDDHARRAKQHRKSGSSPWLSSAPGLAAAAAAEATIGNKQQQATKSSCYGVSNTSH